MPIKDNVGRSLSITSQESYSAVIIADLVAEVQDQPHSPASLKRSHSARSQRHNGKADQTNAAFDGQQTTDVEKSNGTTTNIANGVILNVQLDRKDLVNGKSMELQDGKGKKEEVEKKKSELAGSLKDMSVLRRIAFAASFLPSIMFVLCFAVILPCQKKVPCVEEAWTTILNDTDVTQGPFLSDKVVLTFSRAGAYGLQGLSRATGLIAWEKTVESPLRSLHCGHLISERKACIVSDLEGTVRFYEVETGKLLLSWDPTSSSSSQPPFSSPTVLPDCDGDEEDEVAVAVSKSVLKVLSTGTKATHVALPQGMCDEKPEGLVAWLVEDATDLVCWCRSGDTEIIVRIPQEKWCSSLKKKRKKSEITIIDSRTPGSLKNSHILPTKDGLIVWTGNEVSLFELDGLKNWSISAEEHSSRNRFLLYGKFDMAEPQIALFSSDMKTGFQISAINRRTGQRAWNRSVENAEIGDVSQVQGTKKDFVLVVMREIKKKPATDLTNTLSEVSTSLLNLLTTQKVELNASDSTITEKITFMELNGESSYEIADKEFSYSEGETFSTKVTALSTGDKYMELITVRRSTQLALQVSSQLKKINIANWDYLLSSADQCIVKEL